MSSALPRSESEAQSASAQAELAKAMHSARAEQLEQARIKFERAEDEHRRMKMLHDADSLQHREPLTDGSRETRCFFLCRA